MTPRPAPDDALLQHRLRDALTPDAAEVASLNERVMAQWRQQQGADTAHAEGAGPVRALSGRQGLRPWLIGATALVLGGALTLGLWLQRPDPAMEELLQLDVLSQMAAGEM